MHKRITSVIKTLNCDVHHYEINQYIALGGFLIYISFINIYISGVPRNQSFNLLHVIEELPKILHQIRQTEETNEAKKIKRKAVRGKWST